MRLFGSIILILLSTVNHLRYQFAMGNTIASQFICNDLPGLVAMTVQKLFEVTFRRGSIPLGL